MVYNREYPLLVNGCFLGGPCRTVIGNNEGRLQSVEFREPAGQDTRLEAEELNRGIKASELLSAG
jgi:hypothetical protein